MILFSWIALLLPDDNSHQQVDFLSTKYPGNLAAPGALAPSKLLSYLQSSRFLFPVSKQ